MASAILYAAKSTTDPHGSIDRQLDDGRQLAKRNGWDVVAEYSDEAASAYKGNRGPGLAQAREHAARLASEGQEATLVVQHADRLARGDGVRADHLVELALWARKSGVTITSVQDPSTFEGGLAFAAMMGDRNHEDSRRKAEAVKSGKRGQLARGRALGRLCDGYRLSRRPDTDGKDRTIDPDRAPIVLRAFELVEAGHTPGEVSRILNAAGHQTRNGKPWRARTVRDMVANPFYAGWAFRRDERGKPAELVPGDHEPLIEQGRWEAIQSNLARMSPQAVAHRTTKAKHDADAYILRGIATCRCGAPLYVTPRDNHGRSQRGYRCRDARQSTGVCTARWIPADVAERYVLLHLDSFIADIPAWLQERLHERTSEHEQLVQAVDVARCQLAKLERHSDRVAAQWERWVNLGDEPKADLVLGRLEDAQERVAAQEREVADVVAREAEWSVPASMDEALDFYSDLVALVRGRLAKASVAIEVRAALRSAVRSAQLWLEDDDHLRGIFTLDGRWHFTSGVVNDPQAPADPAALPEWLRVIENAQQTFVTAPLSITIPALDVHLSGRPDTSPREAPTG